MTAVLTGPDLADLRRVVDTALEEDLRYGQDATTAATVPATAVATGTARLKRSFARQMQRLRRQM